MALLLTMGVGAVAAPSSGYYRIKSNAYSGRYIGENSSHQLYTSTDITATDYSYLWYLDISGSEVRIMNAVTQRYVQYTASFSVQYTTSAAATDYNFTLGQSGSTYTFTEPNGGGLHCAASVSYNVVEWLTSGSDSGVAASIWLLEAVVPDAAELASQQAAASLTLTSGYYRILSSQYEGKYITENTVNNSLYTEAASENNYSQVWYLDIDADHNATIRNALSDNYMQHIDSWSAQYTTASSAAIFAIAENKGESTNTYTFAQDGNSGLHCAASLSYNVVRWAVSESASVWKVEPFVVDEAALADEKAALATADAASLKYFFTTAACTEIKDDYKNHSDEELRFAMNYMGLPTTVQDMAVKVKNNAWENYGTWDKCERTFRIADYKAYSNGDRWTSILGYKHHLGRLSNPTGIWVDADDIIQVYVGPVPSGQTVSLEVAGFGDASGSTYPLHEGMNALRMLSSGNCFIFYEVDNTTDGGSPFTALSAYPDVTVHIEGGTVQGYFDLTRGDTDTDWANLKSNLMSKETVCLKTGKHVMNLYRDWLLSALGDESLVAMLTVWADLAQWEDELMGRSDATGQVTYGQYCNNVFSVTSLPGSGDPHAYSYGTYYYEDTHGAIFNAHSLLTVADNLWCIAHEQGHNRQEPINMAGNTEISNNLLSNVAIYKQGRYTSRTVSIQTTFQDYLQGVSWPERVARSCNGEGTYNSQLTHLNWQMYQFFHLNGNDPDFFARLFDALRAEPMTKTNAGVGTWTDSNSYYIYHISAANDYLRYYTKCCEVSGYDLTDFFSAYGFFMLPEEKESMSLDGSAQTRYTLFNDYAICYLYVTQEMIDQAKAYVASMNLPKCNIVFIEDRVSPPLAIYEGHAEGELRTINPDAPVSSFGVVGDVGQYTDFDKPCSAYAYNSNDEGIVTMDGTGAVGFIVYDSSDNIAAFYNTNTFRLPSALYDSNGLKSGYIIKAAAGDGTLADATQDAGIIPAEVFPKTSMWYTLCTTLRGNRYVQCNGAGQGITGTTSNNADLIQWQFVLRNDGSFDIVSRYDGSYLDPEVAYNQQVKTTATRPSAGWKLSAAATSGMYIIFSGTAELNQTNNSNGYPIVSYGWGVTTDDTGCQYAIEEADFITPKSLSATVLPELEGWEVNVAATAADELTTGQWYVMFDRGITSGKPHGYLYEKASEHKLYNTATLPSGPAADACKYLVRLVNANNGTYYIQTGYGNYFGQIQQGTAVPLLTTKSQRVTVAKIANTAGHYYLQGVTGGIVLDANDLGYSGNVDATVVGWASAPPASIGGNDDWAFFPVTLSRTYNLRAEGDASYATFYSNHDMQTDAATKAYYVPAVSDGYAKLTETSNSGRDIPARTAVVLVCDKAAPTATLYQTSGLSSVVSENENLLKGTLTAKLLDLSPGSPYYSLGVLNGTIGFYKFDDNGTTSITLDANKAYLDYATSQDVKGFVLTMDFTDDIDSPAIPGYPVSHSSDIYSLSGQRLSRPMKGVNIVNGKKIFVK